MNKKDLLWKELCEKEEKFEKNKFKRFVYSIIGLTIVFLVLLIYLDKIQSLKDFLCAIPVSIFTAGLYFYINLLIFLPLFKKSEEENKILERLKKEYETLNQEQQKTYNVDKYL